MVREYPNPFGHNWRVLTVVLLVAGCSRPRARSDAMESRAAPSANVVEVGTSLSPGERATPPPSSDASPPLDSIVWEHVRAHEIRVRKLEALTVKADTLVTSTPPRTESATRLPKETSLCTVTRDRIDVDVLRAHIVEADRISVDELHAVEIIRTAGRNPHVAPFVEGVQCPPRKIEGIGF